MKGSTTAWFPLIPREPEGKGSVHTAPQELERIYSRFFLDKNRYIHTWTGLSGLGLVFKESTTARLPPIPREPEAKGSVHYKGKKEDKMRKH